MPSKYHICNDHGQILQTVNTWNEAYERAAALDDAAKILGLELHCSVNEVPTGPARTNHVPLYVVRKCVSDLLSEPICYVYDKDYANTVCDLLNKNKPGKYKVTVT